MKTIYQHTLRIPVEEVTLEGELIIPEKATSLVVFAHGSGSSRFSPRNNFVAEKLRKSGIATFLFDLLTEEEDSIGTYRFNIPLMTARLVEVTNWIKDLPLTKALSIGYFGASTGAASALAASITLSDDIQAVVSRGGRPDLIMGKLPDVKSPTLLIVGGYDAEVLHMNEEALEYLTCPKKLKVIDGATHLFEEPGKLEEVAVCAKKWFREYLVKKTTSKSLIC